MLLVHSDDLMHLYWVFGVFHDSTPHADSYLGWKCRRVQSSVEPEISALGRRGEDEEKVEGVKAGFRECDDSRLNGGNGSDPVVDPTRI